MGKKYSPINHWRLVVQIFAILLFAYLLINGKNKLWMLIVATSLLLTPLLGRFYCGWLCPINTILRSLHWLESKRTKRLPKEIPPIVKSPWLQAVIFTLFLLVLFLTLRGMVKINLILLLIPFAILTTISLNEAIWHCYFCPFGTLFSFLASSSFLRLHINQDRCLACGRCQRECKAEAIIVNETSKKTYHILPCYCLLCFTCQEVCQHKSIETTTIRKSPPEKVIT